MVSAGDLPSRRSLDAEPERLASRRSVAMSDAQQVPRMILRISTV